MTKITTSLLLILLLSGCSFPSAQKDEPGVRADDLEFVVDTLESPETTTGMDPIQVAPEQIAETKIPDEFQAPPIEETAMVAPAEPTYEEFKAPEEITITPDPSPAAMASNRDIAMSGDYEYYEVQKGDTLMMVAFKIYGDYRKWKELTEWNKEQLKQKISAGMKLRYYVPEQRIAWVPSGLPYLVKTGDTLQIISMDKYGTTRKWKSIYENNRPLIRNPDLIFAGFTLYYQPTRDLASQPR